MVRNIVEQVMGEFVRETLPALIKKELARLQHAEGSVTRRSDGGA